MSSQQNEQILRAGERSVEATDIPTAPTAGVTHALPWSVTPAANVVAPNGDVIAHVSAFWNMDDNARYIVAACNAYPELIAALREAVRIVGDTDDWEHEDGTPADVALIRRALAKAEGR